MPLATLFPLTVAESVSAINIIPVLIIPSDSNGINLSPK